MKTPISNKTIPTIGGRVFLGVFFSIFLALGGGFFYFAFAKPVVAIIGARDWQAATCEILSSSVRSHSSSDGDTYSVQVRYRYTSGAQTFEGDRFKFLRFSSSGYAGKSAIVAALPAGKRVPCWVNPENPADAVLERGLTADLWFGLIPLFFMLIGGGGVYAAVLGRRTRLINAVPGLPDLVPHTIFERAEDTRRKPMRLAPRHARHAKLIGIVFVALFWNGIIAVVVGPSVHAWRMGVFAWLSALFMTPFVLIGLGLIVGVVWQAMQLANPRPLLTVGSSLVSLGDEIKVHWVIQGRVEKLTRFTIDLEGREEATYRRGTDTTTDRQVFARISVANNVAPVPAEGSGRLQIPRDTMHSFIAPNNKIVWTLRVKGEIPQWTDSDDEFPLTVAPARA